MSPHETRAVLKNDQIIPTAVLPRHYSHTKERQGKKNKSEYRHQTERHNRKNMVAPSQHHHTSPPKIKGHKIILPM